MTSAKGGASAIGRGTVIRGVVRGTGMLEVAGRIEGSIDLSGDLSVTETAQIRVEGDFSADSVTIAGAVLGPVRATGSIVLEAGAKVVGDLSAPSVGIRAGGLLRGRVATGEFAGKGHVAAARSGSSASSNERAPQAVRAPVRPAQAPAAAPARPVAAPAKPAVVAPAKPSVVAPTVASPAKAREPEEPTQRPRSMPKPSPREAPAPVMPAPKKGQKGQLKRKNG